MRPSIAWPGGARSCVALAFDLDGPTGDAMLDGSLKGNPAYFTLGAYGPYRALPRILTMLETFRLPATFFVPTWVIEHWPTQCRAIIEAGHEVAYHGHRHELFWTLDDAQQREIMTRSQAIFHDLLGVRPVGFRTPSGDWGAQTPDILNEFGVRYSSSMRGDDRPYHVAVDGHPQGLIEIPARWELDDYASLAYQRAPDFPRGLDRTAPYAQVLANWCAEFDGSHEEGLSMTTLLHPKVSARPGRMALLEAFLAHMTAHEDVWFARCRDVAEFWQQLPAQSPGQSPDQEPRHAG
ncbi:polysaccharide deacetylase family protein [Salinicola halimionae]|uniref:polysaccharide deacetylase family protein n=1 Tax=Salinicola halimionae TaxID=1949081 RepID=UPI001CB6C55E|nr:polysaccharide deacetylase [Salinicola halimionae]